MDLDKFLEDDIALAMALSASIQSAAETVPPTVNRINQTGTSSNNHSHTQGNTDGSQTNEIRPPIDQDSDNNNPLDPSSTAASDTFSEDDIAFAEDYALAMALSASIRSIEESVPSSNLINEAVLLLHVHSCLINPTEASSTVLQANEYGLPRNQNRENSDPVDTPPTTGINTYSAEYAELAAEIASLGTSIQYAVESNTPSGTASLIAQTGTSLVSPGPTQSRTSDDDSLNDPPSTEAIDTDSLEDIELAMAIRFLDALVEGACVPCGHMAGCNRCMHCLNEIKAKNLGCSLCGAKIDQVIRIYAA